MTSVVQLAAGLEMDASEAATQTLAAISAKGGGKSYLAGRFVEQLYEADAPFVVLDPIGNWSALRLDATGRGPGLDVVVIGGERGDIALSERHAGPIANYLVTQGVSAVVDISELSKSKRKTYVADFCDALFLGARRVRRPFMVVFEEAQLFAPQHIQRGEERMLGAVTDIVRLGRNYGLGSMLLTQRPQSVSKEVLNQAECLFVGQLRGPHERKAIEGWVTDTGADEGVSNADLKALPALSPGDFYCWSPSWLRTFRKVRILPKSTFDGSSTPVLGRSVQPLTRDSSSTIVEVVKHLRVLGASEEAEPSTSSEPSEGEKVARLRVVEVERENGSLWTRVERLEQTLMAVRGLLGKATEALEEVNALRNVTATVVPRAAFPVVPEATREQVEQVREWAKSCAVDIPSEPMERVTVYGPGTGDVRSSSRDLLVPAGTVSAPLMRAQAAADEQALERARQRMSKPDVAVLRVLVWQQEPLARSRLALMSLYSGRGGAFGNILSSLRGRGLIEGSSALIITEAGRKAIGAVPAPLSGRALFEAWLGHSNVSGPMAAVLTALRGAGGEATRSDLGRLSGYEPTGGSFGNILSDLRGVGLVSGKGREPIRLPDDLR